jgi:hypothetical protein
MKTFSIFAICTAFFVLSCNRDNEAVSPIEIDYANPIVGCWKNPTLQDSLWTFTRAQTIKSDEYALEFKMDNAFVEQKIAGWCATPPVTFAKFEGTWNKQDSILSIAVGYWGGTAIYKWKLKSNDSTHLVIVKISETYSSPQD